MTGTETWDFREMPSEEGVESVLWSTGLQVDPELPSLNAAAKDEEGDDKEKEGEAVACTSDVAVVVVVVDGGLPAASGGGGGGVGGKGSSSWAVAGAVDWTVSWLGGPSMIDGWIDRCCVPIFP